ncbi:class I SAM-dependent methyltransferase [candidate division WOR-3 bacterium]|nr:class I SAM-dependent methyltransferase [candidate division WOR-3 bacterium]
MAKVIIDPGIIKDIKERERAVYDKWAETYDQSLWATWLKTWVEGFLKDVPVASKILDVGCGTGTALKQLQARKPLLLAGLDISPKALDVAREKLAGFPHDLRTADAEDSFPWPDDYFDVAFFNSTIHHFPNPRKPVIETYRVLKTQGRLIVSDPHFPFPFLGVVNIFLSFYPLNGDLHFFSQQGLRRFVESCGFVRVTQRPSAIAARYTLAFKPT